MATPVTQPPPTPSAPPAGLLTLLRRGATNDDLAPTKAVAVPESLEGIVVDGPPAPMPKSKTGRVIRGMSTMPTELRAYLLCTEMDGRIQRLAASGDDKAAHVVHLAQLAESEKRRQRLLAPLRKVGVEVALAWPVLFGGWVWVTIAAALVAITSLSLLKSKGMHGKVVMRAWEALGIALGLQAIMAALTGTHPVPVVMGPVDWQLLIIVPGLVGVLVFGLTLVLLFEHKIVPIQVTPSAMVLAEMLMLLLYVAPQIRGLSWALSWWYLAPPVVIIGPALLLAAAMGWRWAWKATVGDGTIADNLPRGGVDAMAAQDAVSRDVPGVVGAALATKRLPDGTLPALVEPGVINGNNGMIWQATIDTAGASGVGGPSATVLLEPKARAEFAARLGLSVRRVILTVDEDRGSRLHVTGITGRPWIDRPHPLLTLAQVDIADGIPWSVTVEGDVLPYEVAGSNSLFGGESGAGKSTAMAGVWGGFCLSPSSRIWVIDGGEVDTEPLRRAGIPDGWTTDLPEGVKILAEVLAEVDRRQHLLAGSGIRKPNAEWFAEHGLSYDLLLIDELATFTQRKGAEAAEFADILRLISQRCRKTGVHLLLGIQSPSVEAIDADSRDVIPVRWCGRARSADMANKVLGKGAVGRGIDPRELPDVKGVGWFSGPSREVITRPFDLSDADLAAICLRGAALRKGSGFVSAADEDKALARRVSVLVRDEGADVPAGRVMLARELAHVLEIGQDELRLALARVGVRTQKVSRPDRPDAHNHSHYVLSDLPASRAI